MIYRVGRYEIRPYTSSKKCWELWEYRNVKSRKDGSESEEWKFTGQYPSTFEYALKLVMERMLMDGEDTIEAEKIISKLDAIKALISDIAEKDER